MIEIKHKSLNEFTFIDLFAGIGGFRLALESFGAKCLYSSEWDKHAQDTYLANFGEKPKGDITKINELNIPSHDILCAGFPCQAFSISGKQKGFNDSRGTLFFDVLRIAKHHKPKIIFLENVKNFKSHDNGNTLAVVQNSLEDLGYKVFYKVLNAVNYGVPQKRERIYIVCFRNDINSDLFTFPDPVPLNKYVEHILEKDLSNYKNLICKRKDIFLINKNDDIYSDKSIRLGIVNKGGQGERIYSTKGIAITLSANGGGCFAKTGGYLVNGIPRKLTTRECARLMGYPDYYKIFQSTAQAYKQFGNSVVIDVLQYILFEISDVINCRFKLSQVAI